MRNASLETPDGCKAGEPNLNPLAGRYLDKIAAAKLLDISPRTLDLWMAQRRVPFFRIGRTIRFSASDIDSFLMSRCRVADVGGVK